MIALSFHKELYHGPAIDEAVKAFARVAVCELVEEEHRFLVNVTANKPEKELVVAKELDNFALGLSIEKYSG